MERNIAICFNFLSNHLLANLHGAVDHVASQSSERIGFYCNHEEADTQKCWVYHVPFDNIRVKRILDIDVTVISLH